MAEDPLGPLRSRVAEINGNLSRFHEVALAGITANYRRYRRLVALTTSLSVVIYAASLSSALGLGYEKALAIVSTVCGSLVAIAQYVWARFKLEEESAAFQAICTEARLAMSGIMNATAQADLADDAVRRRELLQSCLGDAIRWYSSVETRSIGISTTFADVAGRTSDVLLKKPD